MLAEGREGELHLYMWAGGILRCPQDRPIGLIGKLASPIFNNGVSLRIFFFFDEAFPSSE